MTDLDIYQPAGLGQYQAGIVMTPESAKALDEQVRACTRAVLREGTDYGIIPGTGGTKTLWRPGAQKLLQWFRLGCTCDRTEIETGDDGQRQGVTYRATVTRRLPDGSLETLATCEGYAGYDEDKFYQSAEQVQAKAQDKERMWAKKDRRVADPTRWQNLGEYRAPWNTVIKRAQKRAIVGATVDATAAGGLFSTEEEDDHAPAPQDDGPTWTETAIEQANTFTDIDDGRALYVEAAEAHKRGLCNRRQTDLIQNTIKKRVTKLQHATPVDVEDLARQAAGQAEPDPTRPAAPAATPTATDSSTAPDADGPSDTDGLIEDEPGTVSKAQLTKLHTVLTALGFNGEDREQKLKITEAIIGRPLGGDDEERSSKNLSWTEARKVIDTLDGMDRDQLIAYMAEHEDYVRQETSDG
jgi:hypothetical protein